MALVAPSFSERQAGDRVATGSRPRQWPYGILIAPQPQEPCGHTPSVVRWNARALGARIKAPATQTAPADLTGRCRGDRRRRARCFHLYFVTEGLFLVAHQVP